MNLNITIGAAMNHSYLLKYVLGFVAIALAVLASAYDATIFSNTNGLSNTNEFSNTSGFFNINGLLIVVGGSVAALFASYPVKEIKSAMNKAKSLLQYSSLNEEAEVDELVQFAKLWGRNDIRGIEKRLENTRNRFLHTGIQMLIAKAPLTDVVSTLNWRMKRLKVREMADAKVFHSLAAYAPAFGMVGTLIGLVNMMLVMENQNMESMGSSWAIALVTTFYGLLLANLLFKPIATKLERRTEKRLLLMAIVLEGIHLMGLRRGPAFIRENLHSFVAHYDNELAEPVVNTKPGFIEPIGAHFR